MIFDGELNRIWPLPDDYLQVSVTGTLPYDSAPGGTRSSMAQMDSTEAPYGDIVALHGAHCFIPTMSALDIDTEDLFYDIAGDANLLAHTPFDTVYFPIENQEHIAITAESANWFIDEIERGVYASVTTPQVAASHITLHQNSPNPFTSSTAVRFSLAEAGDARLEVFDIAGRSVALLVDEMLPAGSAQATWNGEDARGRRVAPGIYFLSLSAGGSAQSVKMLLLK